MEGADFVSLRIVWFVLAGFILGFATSTLWEWLYYRRKRQTQLEQATQAMFQSVRADRRASPLDEIQDGEDDKGWAMSYRSPGVYLESEQAPPAPLAPATITHSTSSGQIDAAEQSDPTVTSRATPNAPRLNPATLVTLQSVIAQSSIAQAPIHTKVYPAPTLEMPTAVTSVTPIQQNHKELGNAEIVGAANLPASPMPSTMVADSRSEPQPSTAIITSMPATQSPAQPASVHAPRNNPTTDYPDNLALIKGVGEAYKRRLYGAGIYTWRQVAESDVEILRQITRAKPNANIAGWRQRARDLAEQHQRWDTTFCGPLDDFTRIEGIGAITADTLYKAGLCTYEQLAAALPDELARIVPAPTVGDEIDFEGWINAAVRLANAKHRIEGLLP